MLDKVIAANIRCLRKHKKLTQKELAERLATTRQHISDIERCKKNVSIAMLENIVKKLQVEPYQLLK
ncbi:XRE family transcriptional regulator [Staphylococcus pseudintermedius]|nr:XRE family transcriptional regulator [Staphylococcus pseudintermedius]